MFDIFPNLVSSIASFLFPIFASYKALKTNDPAQLQPWLMYWVVLSCALLVESWTKWILVWFPFYAYIRLLFLLYLVLPQFQGARVLYQTYVHPWLEDNELSIEDFIASAHDRLRAAGIAYIKRAIELLKTNVLGLPPTPEAEAAAAAAAAPPQQPYTPQGYTQSLLARFTLPQPRTGGTTAGTGGVVGSGTDFYGSLASVVSAAMGAAGGSGSKAPERGTGNIGVGVGGGWSAMIPESIRGTTERMTFIQAQRERLNIVLSALDREATQLQQQQQEATIPRADSTNMDGFGLEEENTPRASGRSMSTQSGVSGLSKSRSHSDFENLEAESGAEEDMMENKDYGGVRQRKTPTTAAGGWMPWGWGSTPTSENTGKSSGLEK
ncbi:receptor expression-enhancing protein 2 [Diplogelasinospora grovesii]|uniref:Protein YOP1 n=1 Tax=Diplogelasinospora grovesii TaxID=303347 RepID=A0AAN6S978_9PEZI|nr:receptor expression-enhancing protein 2 [Diplogelasinospora grovesii]